MLFLLSGAAGASAQGTVPSGIAAFHVDPRPAAQPSQFADFEVTREDLSTILTTYRVVSREDWYQNYHHVAGGDRTGSYTSDSGIVVRWLVRPGGLARLTLADRTELHLVRTADLSELDVRTISTRLRDVWLLRTELEEERWLAQGTVQSVTPTDTGWHVAFTTRTGGGPGSQDGLHIYYLHVYLDAAGKLERIVRGPDVIG